MSLTRTFYFEDTKVAELHSRVTDAERDAGTESEVTTFSPSDIKDMIDTHSSGGVGNLTFFSLSADVTLTATATDHMSGNFTPPSMDTIVGMLISVGINSTSSQFSSMRLRRGTSDVTDDITTRSNDISWHRQLFLDKPGSTSQQSYALRGKTGSQGFGVSVWLAGSSMTVFAMPDDVVADILTSDESVSQDTDFLSVTITPSSTSAKIKLNVLVLSGNIDIAVRRGATELQEVATRPELPDNRLPSNFEDWVDEPNTTNAVTYHIRKTDSGTLTIEKGSYLMAQEVA